LTRTELPISRTVDLCQQHRWQPERSPGNLCAVISEGGAMDPAQMEQLFRTHRDAEERHDFDAIMKTFRENCYLEMVPLGSRSEGQAATRAAYVAYFTAFPDLTPDDRGFAFGEDVMVAWGFLSGTSGGDWLGVTPSGQSFSAVPFSNVATFADELMVGESVYFDLATLCEQAGLPLDDVRRAAKERAQAANR
jgi:predicted ester cyclase